MVFTTDHSPSVIRTYEWRSVANSCAYVLPYLRTSMKVLDVGCGPGSITMDLAKKVPEGHVTGIDYVDEPLKIARLRAAQQGITNIDFHTGDIYRLDFPASTFDLVHAHQVLQHIADPVRALKEMRRVVKPGGIVAVRESASCVWYPESQGIHDYHKLSACVSKDKGGHPHPGSHIHLWARDAGFELRNIRRTTGSWCFSTPEEREYWGGSIAERVVSSGFAKILVEEGYCTADDLHELEQAWRHFINEEVAWYSMLHGEMVCVK
ncbi:S-adenosyl-L-methionine-dependent methyltransferase [Aspergillus ambiguus]|uniref:class I SAM-dependent methyltransferase n=1 Tax=Aspergillus ambiguus TaxID=176160 RepID=UPI003CCC9A04